MSRVRTHSTPSAVSLILASCVATLVHRLTIITVSWGSVSPRWLVCFSQTLIGMYTSS